MPSPTCTTGLAPRPDTDDERAGAALQGGEEADESGGSVPERDERGHVGYGDNLEEQRGMVAKRYLSMEALEAVGKPNPQHSTR